MNTVRATDIPACHVGGIAMDRKKDRKRRGSDPENEDMRKKHKGYHISRWVYSAKRYIYKPIRETERQTGK